MTAESETPIVADANEFDRIEQLLLEAAAHAHVGEEIPTGSRMRPAKKALVKALRPVTSFQRVYNTKVLLALTRLKDHFEQVARNGQGAPGQLDRLNISLATLEVALDQVNDRVRAIDGRVGRLEENHLHATELQTQCDRIDAFDARLKLIETKQNVVLREARMALGGDSELGALRTLATELEGDDARLYADMENLFRGSRTDVLELFRPYVDDVTAVSFDGPVVDIGCGRGEWLELLREASLSAYGLDLNPITVDECVARGLDARKEDVVAHLSSLPDGSIRAITGFHIAEHLSLDGLLSIIESAFVALTPGGVLVLETPNCTNLSVGAASFYLDPTHIKPLHPQLLEFLCLHRGFDSVEIRYLHPRRTETPSITGDQHIDNEMNWALFGPMDYAVIAKKAPKG